MPRLRITNCHIHTFTRAHVPKNYPHPAVNIFKSWPPLVRGISWLLKLFGQEALAETVDRLLRFQQAGAVARQRTVFEAIRRQYPDNTRFVVLPMDMEFIGHGPTQATLAQQHDELAALAGDDDFRGRVIAFASVHPDRPGAADEVFRAIDDLGFRGLKLYPRLGFPPDHPLLMDKVYPMLQARGLPVMSHCSRGGVRGRHVTRSDADAWTDPAAFVPVLERFPDLRVCLAHFGGAADWRAYVDEGIDPRDPQARAANWQVAIRDMITSGAYPNLWTDISYTLFHFDDNIPFLKLFLGGADAGKAELLRARVLFGSDFYMTRQEKLSERAVCFRLRNALGEDVFRQIAETNPEIWLGERAAV